MVGQTELVVPGGAGAIGVEKVLLDVGDFQGQMAMMVTQERIEEAKTLVANAAAPGKNRVVSQ